MTTITKNIKAGHSFLKGAGSLVLVVVGFFVILFGLGTGSIGKSNTFFSVLSPNTALADTAVWTYCQVSPSACYSCGACS